MTCPYYDLKPTYIHVYSPRTGKLLGSKHDFVGICYGTRECEECSCGGNREKCDFYPEYRKKSVTNADRMIEMLKSGDTKNLLDWWEEIFEDGVPGPDYFEWWLEQPVDV